MARRKKRGFSVQSLLLAVFLLIVALAGGTYFSGLNPETLAFETPAPTPASTASHTLIKPADTAAKLPGGRIFVMVLDVGKADSILVVTPQNHAMLVDAGEKGAYPVIHEALERMNVKKLDVLVATHPHNDHIGGMKSVIENYDIGSIYMPSVSVETSTYENLMKAISKKKLKPKEAKAGVTIDFDPDVSVSVLAPLKYDYDNVNNCSAVIKLTFGQVSILLAGDAEKESEKDMLEAYQSGELRANVLKVGHHGSATSSTSRFLSAVRPSVAVISVAPVEGSNSPHKDVLERLTKLKCQILRTDLDGTITLISDGKTVKYQ